MTSMGKYGFFDQVIYGCYVLNLVLIAVKDFVANSDIIITRSTQAHAASRRERYNLISMRCF